MAPGAQAAKEDPSAAHQRFPHRSEEAHLVQGAHGLPLESLAQGPLSPNGAHQDCAREEAAPGVGSLDPACPAAPLRQFVRIRRGCC